MNFNYKTGIRDTHLLLRNKQKLSLWFLKKKLKLEDFCFVVLCCVVSCFSLFYFHERSRQSGAVGCRWIVLTAEIQSFGGEVKTIRNLPRGLWNQLTATRWHVLLRWKKASSFDVIDFFFLIISSFLRLNKLSWIFSIYYNI